LNSAVAVGVGVEERLVDERTIGSASAFGLEELSLLDGNKVDPMNNVYQNKKKVKYRFLLVFV